MLTDVIRVLSQTLQANIGTVPEIKALSLPSTSFPILHSPITLSLDATLSQLLKNLKINYK
jgi:hypothetical protein